MYSSMSVVAVEVPGGNATGVPEGDAVSFPSGGGRSASLGTIARFASAYGKQGQMVPIPARELRFMRQAGARDLVPDERVALCLRRPIPGSASVSVLYSPKRKAAHYGGLLVCGSVWMCPVCAAKISERRRDELSVAIAAWGGQIIMATFTLQHTVSDALGPLLDSLQDAMRGMRSGRRWMAIQEQHGVVGSVRGLEVTHGDHGFHPHQHVLFFVSPGVDVDVFTQQLRDRWMASAARLGRYASPLWGLHVTAASADVAAYVAKWGKEPKWTAAHELAKAGSKRGRSGSSSMLQLLEWYVVMGDVEAGTRWREYALAFKGKKQLVYSKGLRALLGLIAEEKTDQEIVEEAVEDAVVLALLDLAAWRVVLGNDARAELLTVASSGDPALVRSFLVRLGVELEVVPDDS